ncbi:MAG: CHAT domain-containing protein [Anaerolineae bacterium]|nr:MAG: CHAT domain-containing protein [Anaerolineae bacterium]
MTSVSTPAILLAFANDRDDRARYLRNLAEEARQVQRALAAAEGRGHCELVLRQNVTAADILDVFQDALPGSYRHLPLRRPCRRLSAAAGDGRGQPGRGERRWVGSLPGPTARAELVFLNGCSTEGQVLDLLAAGVSAVIATDQAVDDAAATGFAVRFYQGLAGGASIAAAFEQARAALDMQGGRIFRDIGAAEEVQKSGVPWRLHIRHGAETVADWSLPQAVGDPLFGLPALPPLDMPDKPYRYLHHYRREDAWVFFGRDREIRAVRPGHRDGRPAHRAFYGQSGVGKSSLLAAGLLPRLEDSHEVRYARRSGPGLLGTLAAALKRAGRIWPLPGARGNGGRPAAAGDPGPGGGAVHPAQQPAARRDGPLPGRTGEPLRRSGAATGRPADPGLPQGVAGRD